VRDVALLDQDTGACRSVIPFADAGCPRFNDTSAGPGGECFAGTMGVDGASGGLFKLGRDGRFELLFRGTGCSNGMGWTPDRRTMYWTNTTQRTIEAFDYDVPTGTMSNRRLLIAVPKETGYPDGLAVDSAGTIYSARWDGASIGRYDASGRLLDEIPIPADNVTSMCFAGPDLRDLYVSSATGNGPPKPNARPHGGGLFKLRVDVPGQLDFHSDIAI
jgi:D-xylonolactonase